MGSESERRYIFLYLLSSAFLLLSFTPIFVPLSLSRSFSRVPVASPVVIPRLYPFYHSFSLKYSYVKAYTYMQCSLEVVRMLCRAAAVAHSHTFIGLVHSKSELKG
jgi:hypothetical protein